MTDILIIVAVALAFLSVLAVMVRLLAGKLAELIDTL
jgi:hypothetical protein